MKSNELLSNHKDLKTTNLPIYGSELIRQICLPDLLGKETESILYYMGKNLARKLPLNSIDDIIVFFEQSGWGDIEVHKDKKTETVFTLTGELIKLRFSYKEEPSYSLEAGFLAEQMTIINETPYECIPEVISRKKMIQFRAATSE